MFFINTQTLEYPVTEGFIRAQYHNTSFPVPFVAPEPYASVKDVPKPEFNPLREEIKETSPVFVNGAWERQYTVVSLDPETIKKNEEAEQLRVMNEIIYSTQARLDAFAKTRSYDGILSLCTYATSAVPRFRSDGQYGVQVRDATWAKLYEILAEVEAGTRPIPSGYQDIEAELPVLGWPA